MSSMSNPLYVSLTSESWEITYVAGELDSKSCDSDRHGVP